MIQFCDPVSLEIVFAFEEPATTTENRMVSSITQVRPQVIHTVQLTVAIPASEGINHLTSEWMDEACNTCLICI